MSDCRVTFTQSVNFGDGQKTETWDSLYVNCETQAVAEAQASNDHPNATRVTLEVEPHSLIVPSPHHEHAGPRPVGTPHGGNP